jgi:putative hydrolase of the HAD superfamily
VRGNHGRGSLDNAGSGGGLAAEIVVPTSIEAILFDVNGTLRVREPHEQTQRAAFARLQELIGRDDIDWDELTRRQKSYGDWAQANLVQLSEAEIWSRWMLPETPRERIEPVAAELMLAWSERKGRTIPVPGAEAMLVELRKRGYRLGIISNSMSTLDIPRTLQTFGWEKYFDVVILSSSLKIRRPSPEPFCAAARCLNLPPNRCVYLGNRISRDVVGCKRAGFALGLIIEPIGGPRTDAQDQTIMPDAVIHSLSELLDIFPASV